MSSNNITGNAGSFYGIINSSILHIYAIFSPESVPKYLSPLFPSQGNKKEWVKIAIYRVIRLGQTQNE